MDNKFENFKLKVNKLVNHYSIGNFKFVIEQINLLLKKQPNNQFILNLLGSCYQKVGNFNIAKKVFLRVIELDNNNLAAMNNLANVYKDLNEPKNAEKFYKKILKINPNYINTINNYAGLNFKLNKHEEAIALYKKAAKIDNNTTIVHYNLGLVYQSLGKFKEAEFHFREVLRIDPNMNIADRIMGRFIKYDKNNNHLKEMLQKIDNKKLNDESKINLNFALGKAYEDLLDFKKSFFYLEKGNKIKDSISKYDVKADNLLFNDIKNFFENYNYDEKIITQKSNKKIIFILGLPRSGTSLIEQIIASHPDVYGSGELNYLEKLITNNFFKENILKIPNLKKEIGQELIKKISAKYFELIGDFKSNKQNITDKAPLNFMWIGFIKILFPNAKVIHCVRDPKDNCLSLYKNIFDENQNWTYNKSNLFNYYKNYYELMNFWKKKFPNFIFDCKYEDLIVNSNIEIKKLLNFCDLSWDDNCLKFYNTKRPIKTLSVAQARQPLYTSSISSNKNFEPFLSDLFINLENLLK